LREIRLFTSFSRILQIFTGFYRILPDFAKFADFSPFSLFPCFFEFSKSFLRSEKYFIVFQQKIPKNKNRTKGETNRISREI